MKTFSLEELNEHIRSAIEYFDLKEKDMTMFMNVVEEVYKTAWQDGYDIHRILTMCETED